MSEQLLGYHETIPGEAGVSTTSVRHGPKNTNRVDSMDNPQELTPEGRELVRLEAEAYFRYIINVVPAGGIISLNSSTIGRAQDTRDIFVETIRECARDATSGVVMVSRYKRNGKPHSDAHLRRKTRDARWKYVITDERSDEDFGYRPDEHDNIVPFTEAVEFFQDEHFVNMIWAAQPDEIPALIERLYIEMLGRYPSISEDESKTLYANVVTHVGQYVTRMRRTPEELVANQLEGVRRSVLQALRVRPDRRHVLHLTQHAPGLSYLALALFGQEISFKNYDELGDNQQYLEGVSYSFDTAGKVQIDDFRGKRSSIGPVVLDDLIAELYVKSEERRQHWQEYFQGELSRAA